MARRVNTKFLTILSLIVVGGVIALLIAPRLLKSRDADKFIAAGEEQKKLAEEAQKKAREKDKQWIDIENELTSSMDESTRAKKLQEADKAWREAVDAYATAGTLYKEAANYFRDAVNARPNDPALIVKCGDMLYYATSAQPDFKYEFRTKWEKALEQDPSYQPALRRLLRAYQDWCDVTRRPESYALVRKAAERLLELNKNGKDAPLYESYAHLATIGAWLSLGSAADAKIDKALDALLALVKKYPLLAEGDAGGDEIDRISTPGPEIPYLIAVAYRQREVAQLSTAASLDRTKLRATVKPLFEKEGSGPPSAQVDANSAVLWFRYYQFLSMLTSDIPDSERRTAEVKDLRPWIERAATAVRAEDRRFVDIQIAWAQYLSQSGDAEGANKAYRSLLAQRPNDQEVRNAMARSLRFKRDGREEATRLLSQRVADNRDALGFRVHRQISLEAQRLTELCQLLLDSIEQPLDESVREARLAQIDETYAAAVKIMGTEDDPHLLTVRARRLLAQRKGQSNREAIHLLHRAYEKITAAKRFETEVTFLLANAYYAEREYGMAENLLRECIERAAGWVAARKILAEILFRKGAQKDAEQHVQILEKLAPDDSGVTRLRLMVAAGNKDTTKISALLDQLPEKSVDDMALKAQLLVQMREFERAEKVLVALFVADKEGKYLVSTTQYLAGIYSSRNQKEKARDVVAAAIERKPNDKALRYVDGRLKDLPPEQLKALIEEMVSASTTDPVERELQAYQVARQNNNLKDANRRQAALRVGESDPRVWIACFEYNLEQRKLDEAEKYARKLGDANFDHVGGLSFLWRLGMVKGAISPPPGDWSAAKAAAEQWAKAAPEFSDAYVALGQSYQAEGQNTRSMPRLQQARDYYDKALRQQLTNFAALRGLIECSYSMGDLASAKNYIGIGIQRFPQNPYFREQSMVHEELFGDPEKIVPDREKAKDRDQNNPSLWLALAGTYIRCGNAHALKTENVEAVKWYTKAKELLNNAKVIWPEEIEIYVRLLEVHDKVGTLQDAVAEIQQLSDRPAWKAKPDPASLLGQLYFQHQKWKEAEAAFQDAVTKSGNSLQCRVQLADYYLKSASLVPGYMDKGLDVYEKIVADTKDSQAMRQLINLQIKGGRFDRASENLRAALAATPNDPDFLSLQGFWWLRKQQDEDGQKKAIECFDQAIKSNAQAPLARRYRGILRARQANISGALEDLSVAAEQLPADTDIRMAMAEIFRQRGETDSLIRMLEEALRIDPARRDARDWLIRLYAVRDPMKVEDLLKATQLDPKLRDPQWMQRWALFLLDTNKVTEAIPKIRQAIEMAPREPVYRFDYADILIRTKEYVQAGRELDQVLSIDKRFENTWRYHLLRGLSKQGILERDAALTEFEAALKFADNDQTANLLVRRMVDTMGITEAIRSISAKAQEDLRFRVLLSLLYLEDKQPNKAAETIEAMIKPGEIEKLPSDRQVVALRAAGIVALASAHDTASYQRAVDVYLRLANFLESNPAQSDPLSRAMVYNNLACMLVDNVSPPKPGEAERYARKAFEIMVDLTKGGPRNSSVLDTMGWVLVRNGESDASKLAEGIKLLYEAATNDSTLVDAIYHLGVAYQMNRQYSRAEQQYQTALSELRNRPKADEQFRKKIEESLTQVQKLMKGGR